MSLTISQNALSTAAEKIVDASPVRRRVRVKNHDGSIIVYIGTSASVSSSNGFQCRTNEIFEVEGVIGELWAVAASSTPSVGIVIEEF